MSDEVTPDGFGSIKDALRKRSQEISASKTTRIDLPGYDGLLVAQYHVLDVTHDIQAINSSVRRQYKQEGQRMLYSTLQVMARACDEIFARRDVLGELRLVPLSESIGPDEPPITYDLRLAEFMGWNDITEQSSASDVILRLFSGIETMVLDHGMMLSRWMTNTTKEVTAELEGEL